MMKNSHEKHRDFVRNAFFVSSLVVKRMLNNENTCRADVLAVSFGYRDEMKCIIKQGYHV